MRDSSSPLCGEANTNRQGCGTVRLGCLCKRNETRLCHAIRPNSVPQAGIVIVQEAGGFFTGSAKDFERGDTPIGDIMMNRRYCCIRAIAPSGVCVEG